MDKINDGKVELGIKVDYLSARDLYADPFKFIDKEKKKLKKEEYDDKIIIDTDNQTQQDQFIDKL